MDKVYSPKAIENKWYQKWEQENCFTATNNPHKDYYCIMIPPPNVTGSLHMGHAFQDTIMDMLTRYNKMENKNTLWQMGTDHAGIATQMVVERQLLQQGKNRHELGREEFVKKIWEWKNESGNKIQKQLKRLGCSLDWSRERFTMDEGLSAAVVKVFVDLYRENLIYRGKRLVNWDPVLETAVSDLEVMNTEEDGNLWEINYPLADGSANITIATTRPETMLGDTAIAVNPKDERYLNIIGKEVIVPICNRKIKVIADDYVDPEFGSGCVKITPAHDFNDYAIGKRHNLELINIFDSKAHLNTNVPESYRGLERFAARKKILQELASAGLLKQTIAHKLKLPRGDRSKAILEPWLTDQWFVATKELAEPALNAVKDGEIKFIPSNWDKTYYQWLENIEDWCISRQLWWGHRIPAWYDDKGNTYVGLDEEDVRKHYNLNSEIKLSQDEDVLDTWFSSALWPFSTLGWPEKTVELENFYPTSVLVTGFDIIFFWVARMIMFGLKFTGKVPFKHIYIHGLILDPKGQKMSKSKGNVIDPLDLIDGISIEELIAKRTNNLMQPQMAKSIAKQSQKEFPDGINAYGTDALRFTFCSLATKAKEIRFEVNKLESYRNFCNKLWNAARFVLMNLEANLQLTKAKTNDLNIADRWILSIWNRTKANIAKHFENYRFDLLATEIYEFTWNQYCDWYLELAKPVLMTKSNSKEAKASQYTLVTVLEEILQVMHPITPFITEEIFARILELNVTEHNTTLLENSSYPKTNATLIDDNVEQEINWLQDFILAIRNIKAQMNIPPKKELEVLICNANSDIKSLVTRLELYLKNVANVTKIKFIAKSEAPKLVAAAMVLDLEVLVPLADVVDTKKEKERLTNESKKLTLEIKKCEQKLNNKNYIANAPQEIVNAQKDKHEQLQKSLTVLEERLKNI